MIRAAGITRLYAACPDDVRMRRRWSAADSRIVVAVEAALGGRAGGLAALPAAPRPAPPPACRPARHRGPTANGVLAVLLDTFTRTGLEPPLQAAARLAARIADHLAETGITVAGASAAGTAPRPAPPAPAIPAPGRRPARIPGRHPGPSAAFPQPRPPS